MVQNTHEASQWKNKHTHTHTDMKKIKRKSEAITRIKTGVRLTQGNGLYW